MAAVHPEPFHRRALHSSGRDLHYTPYKPQERLRSDSLFLFRDTAMSSQSNCQNDGEKGFRYLGFFHDAAQKGTTRLSSIYGYARENSGPLKQGVYAMEGAVKFFVNPVYQKVKGKPLEILQFANKKVGNVIDKLDSCVPPTLKSRTCEIYGATKKAPEVAKSVVTEVRQVGTVEKIKEVAKPLYAKSEPSAKNLYNKYETVAKKWCMLAWYKLRQFPLVPQVVETLTNSTKCLLC